MSAIQAGQPLPIDGKRRLTAREALQRAKAMDCLQSRQTTQCQGQVYVGLFFDGTGNNHQWVEPGQDKTQRERNKHSNVARLFDSHLNEPQNGFFRYYIAGVGTPFEEVGDTSEVMYDYLGMGCGYMGADRINYGITSIFNAVHRYLLGSDLLDRSSHRALVNAVSTAPAGPLSTEGLQRWSALTAVEERLAAVVRSHQRKVTQINVSIFGFSRGAAEARACAYWLNQLCERNGGGLALAGIPLRIGFMGIFDTVAAVGIGDIMPFTDGHMAWADGTQAIHPAVEECVHFIALHEQRASFPLEAAVGRRNVSYPGMHSDVGGGYCPGDQGKAMPEWAPSPHLSQIPLLDMHFAALKAGVPMMTIEQIRADARLSRTFSVDPRLAGLYNAWLQSNSVGAGDIQQVTEAHARHYIRWRASLHLNGRGGVKAEAFFARAKNTHDKDDMSLADQDFGLHLKWLQERQEANATMSGYLLERTKDALRLAIPGGTGRLLIEPGKTPLTAYERKFLEIASSPTAIPAACIPLFQDYVHDSRAGFRPGGHHEPVFLTGGYLRFRHVFREAPHAGSPVYGWANQGLAEAKAAGNALAQFLSDMWDATARRYQRARAAASDAVHRAAAAVSRAYQEAEQEVWRRCAEAERSLYEQLIRRYQPF